MTGRRLLAGTVLILLLSPVAGLKVVENIADRRAQDLAQTLAGATRQETVLNVARWTAVEFARGKIDLPWYRRYDFLLSHRLMPEFLRVPRGTTDLFYLDGWCNSMSGILTRVYAEAGLDAVQHDLISPSAGGHSAVSVQLDGRWAYIDPFMGAAFAEKGRLLSLSRLQALAKRGHDPREYLIPLRKKPRLILYDQLKRVAHAREGERLEATIELPLAGGRVAVGRLNGQWKDVRNSGPKLGLTSYLHALGPRYNRNFFFRFIADPAEAPGGFRIVFHLTEAPDPDHLPESNVPAILGEKTVAYETGNSREGIRLSYKNMGWSLKRLLKGRSWYEVDMIEIERL